MTQNTPYRTAPLLGELEVIRLVSAPRATKTLARILMVGFVFALIALSIVPWQQSSFGKGRVIAELPLERRQTIEAPIEGRVSRWYVQEGSQVAEGDPIADIADNDPEIMSRLDRERVAFSERIEAARARVLAVEERIAALRASQRSAAQAADARVRMAEDRVRAASEAVAAVEAAQKTAGLNLERQSALLEKGLTSKRTVELAELDSERARTEVERARASLGAAGAEVAALAADQAKVGNDASAAISDATATKASAQAEIAAASVELTRLDVRVARQKTQSVTAPRGGTILRLVAKQGGEMVKAGDTLAVLVPHTGERAVEIWIDGNDVNLVTPGRAVRLQFDGWPAVQFSGWPSAAVGTYGGRVALVDAADDGHGKFRVMVLPDGDAPWPAAEFLRQGARANGWILLDRVSLGYELWRQFNGFPPEWTQGKGGEASSSGDSANKGGAK